MPARPESDPAGARDDAYEDALTEWLDSRLRGDAVDVAAFALRHHLSPAQVQSLQCAADEMLAWHAPRATPLMPVPGARFGDFEIGDEIGRGAFGTVYRGLQVPLRRPVAIKVLSGDASHDPRRHARFLREAKAAAGLDHPNLVRVIAAGEQDGVAFIAMEWVSGGTLAQRLSRGPIAAAEAVPLVRKVASAVQAAHDLGVLHRDIKPANILLDRAGEPRLADFGLAKLVGEESLTFSTDQLGTPAYSSPEQLCNAHEIGPASDVWALGMTLFECLTGHRPFGGSNVDSVIQSVLHDEPRRLREVDPQLEAPLEAICGKCLEKEPRHRYPTAAALAADLETWLRGDAIAAQPSSLGRRAWRWARRRVRPILAVAAVGALAVAFLNWRVAHAKTRETERLQVFGRLVELEAGDDAGAYAALLTRACTEFPAVVEFRVERSLHRTLRADYAGAAQDVDAAASYAADPTDLRALQASLAAMPARSELAPPQADALVEPLQRASPDPVVTLMRGRLLHDLGHWQQAIAQFVAAAQGTGRFRRSVALSHAVALFRVGNHDCVRILEPHVAAHSPPADHTKLLTMARYANDGDRVDRFAARLIELYPHSAHAKLAELLAIRPEQLRRADGSLDAERLRALFALARACPDWREAQAGFHHAITSACSDVGAHELVIEFGEEALRHEPDQLGILSMCADSHVELGNRTRGLQLARTLAERTSTSRPAMADAAWGSYHFKAEDYATALGCFERAVEQVPTDSYRFGLLGDCLARLAAQAPNLADHERLLRRGIDAHQTAIKLGRLYNGRQLVELRTALVALRRAAGGEDAGECLKLLHDAVRTSPAIADVARALDELPAAIDQKGRDYRDRLAHEAAAGR